MTPRLKMRGYGTAAIVVLTATVGWMMVQLPVARDDAAAAKEAASQASASVGEVQKQVNANAQALADANRRLVALGKAPVPVPKVTPPSPVYQDEFTAAEAQAVRAIVAGQLEAKVLTQAEITQIAKVAAALVPKPADGKTPTPAQLQTYVKVAVATYCLEGRCQGKPGSEGPRGDPGKDAPKVTDEELLKAAQTALAAYCALETHPCRGKDGTDGKDGPRGVQGRSLSGMDCMPDGRWRLYFTDPATDTQTTEYVNGPCRVL